MKKAFILLCMVAGLVSCAKEASEQENMPQTGVPMTFNVTVLETKAAKADWADGDKIYVFFNGLETKYLKLERSSGAVEGESVAEAIVVIGPAGAHAEGVYLTGGRFYRHHVDAEAFLVVEEGVFLAGHHQIRAHPAVSL